MKQGSVFCLFMGAALFVCAQDVVTNETSARAEMLGEGAGFIGVVSSGGFLGVLLWLALAALSIAGTHLIVDSFIKIRAKRIIPTELVDRVREALASKNISQALQLCGGEPGALSNILTAGFANASAPTPRRITSL